MGLAIGQRQRASPGAAEKHPFLHAQMFAQPFHIGHEMGCGVVFKRAQRGRASGAALVENDDVVMGGIEKTPRRGPGPDAGAAVKKHHRNPRRAARLLPIHDMGTVQGEACPSGTARCRETGRRRPVRTFLPAPYFCSRRSLPMQPHRSYVRAHVPQSRGGRTRGKDHDTPRAGIYCAP